MSAEITLEDGRTWWASNQLWAYVVEAIGTAVRNGGTDHADLAAWLLCRSEAPPGVGGFDIRGLRPADRAAFWAGAQQALDGHRARGASGGADETRWARSTDRFSELLRMHELIVSGAPPETLNHGDGVKEHDGNAIDLAERLWCTGS